MRRARLIPLGLFLLASPSWGAGTRVHVDYDPEAVFSEYTTFQVRNTWHDLRQESSDLHEWVLLQMIGYARSGGLALVPGEPDLHVAYYAAYPDDLELTRDQLEYAYGERFSPGTYWRRGVGTRDGEAMSFTFKRGTIVVDVWDRRRGVLVWRGMATGAFGKGRQIDRRRLARALARVMKCWDEMYGDSAEAIRKLEVRRQR